AQPKPAELAAIAEKLPPLPSRDGAVVFPLADSAAFRWRAMREGVAVEQNGALHARYRVVTGQPAGAVLVVRPGVLDGVTSLRLRVTANRNTNLIVTLQDRNGIAYAFPSV